MIHTVGVADMMLSGQPSDVLITHALGSCLGIVVYDFKLGAGGLLHTMLPDSGIDRTKLQDNPFMFVDSGMRLMLDKLYRAGSVKKNLIVRAAGGSSSKQNEEEDFFQIGRRNFVSLRKFLWDEGLMLKSYDIGGYGSRTVTLEIDGGRMTVKYNGTVKYI
jgi:chemotaxis protein CheD